MQSSVKNNRKAQMSILIIVAIVIVMTIVVLMLYQRTPQGITPDSSDPRVFIESCVRDAVNPVIDKMLPQGGFVQPENYKVYKDTNISYLCVSEESYNFCVNQHPMFIDELQQEILKNTEVQAESCFDNLKTELEKKQSTVDYSPAGFEALLSEGKLEYKISRRLSITRQGNTKNFDSFDVKIHTPLYDLATVASEITNSQAKYCYFEYADYMIAHPWVDITVFTMSDSTRIYTLKDKSTGEVMNIAIKGCTIPPGG